MAGFTPDAIPDVSDVRAGLQDRLERHRVLILGGVAVLVIGSLALLAFSSVRRDREDALNTQYHAIVDDFEEHRTLYNFGGGDPYPLKEVAEEQAKKLLDLREKARGSDVEPWILIQTALRWQVAGQDEKALATLRELKETFPDSPVLQIQAFDDARSSLVSHLESVSHRRREFDGKTKVVVPKPDLARSALVETDLGTLKFVFYPELAPKHVEAFVRQAKSGGFNGTRIYLVRQGEYFEGGGGDFTRDDLARNDREDDPSLAIAPEDSSRLYVKHRRRILTSGNLPLSGDEEDRFAVVLAESWPEFDGLRTPFGELLDDATAGIADRIASAMTFSKDAKKIGRSEAKESPNTPSQPIVIRRVSIWKEGVLEPGHSWDTARVGTDNPEPAKDEKPPVGDGKKEDGK